MGDQLKRKTTPKQGPESQVALKQRGWWTSNPKPPGGVGGRKTETAGPTPPAIAVQTTEQRRPALKGLCRGDREHVTTRAVCAHMWHVCECVKSSHHVLSHDHRATFLFYDFITSQRAYRDFLKDIFLLPFYQKRGCEQVQDHF